MCTWCVQNSWKQYMGWTLKKRRTPNFKRLRSWNSNTIVVIWESHMLHFNWRFIGKPLVTKQAHKWTTKRKALGTKIPK
jgi:hypothetical protein